MTIFVNRIAQKFAQTMNCSTIMQRFSKKKNQFAPPKVSNPLPFPTHGKNAKIPISSIVDLIQDNEVSQITANLPKLFQHLQSSQTRSYATFSSIKRSVIHHRKLLSLPSPRNFQNVQKISGFIWPQITKSSY